MGMKDVFKKLNSAKPVGNARYPLIGEGEHLLVVDELRSFDGNNGFTLAATFVVKESATHEVGSRVSAVWMPAKAPPLANMTSEIDRLADFLGNGLGLEDVATEAEWLCEAEQMASQPLKGMQVEVTGWKGKTKDGGTSDYVRTKWKAVEQTEAEIARERDAVESNVAAAPSAPTPPPEPAVTASVARTSSIRSRLRG
jgi:hypothetical protein